MPGGIDFSSVSGFLLGADCACHNGLLMGFDEWLVVKVGYGTNLAWPHLILELAFRTGQRPSKRIKYPSTPDEQKKAVDLTFELLREYFELVDHPSKLRRIYLQYEGWLRKQSWYDSDWPEWVETWADKPRRKKR